MGSSGADLSDTYRADSEPIWVGADKFQTQGGAPSRANAIWLPYWSMPDGSAAVVTASVMVPSTWTTFSVKRWGYGLAAGPGNVSLLQAVYADVANGVIPDTAGSGVLSVSEDAVVGAQDTVGVSTIGTTSAITAGRLIRLLFRRNGNAGGDTYAGAYAFAGFELTKVT